MGFPSGASHESLADEDGSLKAQQSQLPDRPNWILHSSHLSRSEPAPWGLQKQHPWNRPWKMSLHSQWRPTTQEHLALLRSLSYGAFACDGWKQKNDSTCGFCQVHGSNWVQSPTTMTVRILMIPYVSFTCQQATEGQHHVKCAAPAMACTITPKYVSGRVQKSETISEQMSARNSCLNIWMIHANDQTANSCMSRGKVSVWICLGFNMI